MRRIGIDVGGTNTDAVLIENNAVLGTVKTPTTDDVTNGIKSALRDLVAKVGGAAGPVEAVMIGTTHFTNAVVQRRDLTPVAAVRIGLPASASLPPFVDWPDNLAGIARGDVFMVQGGHEYDGRPLVPFDRAEMRRVADAIRNSGVTSVAVCAVFSPLTSECEETAAETLRSLCPDVRITMSHELGRIGLLERENATLLNACLIDLACRTTQAFKDALRESEISAPLYLTQNDGTVARSDHSETFPVYSIASGPTNSMRGAAFLSQLDHAMVVDVGGTTTDVGCLKGGFPRQANNIVEIGGVRTLFRMPDLLSIALGGGTIIDEERLTIGPHSVGHRIIEESRVFGGAQLTATDIGVASGLVDLGDRSLVAGVNSNTVASCRERIESMIVESVDRMKTDATPLPLIAVGGGAFLVPESMPGIAAVVRVDHAAVANAVGAAIAQVSGEVDQIFSDIGRERAIEAATVLAQERAVEAGAAERSLNVVEIEDLPISYLPGDARRVRVRVVGETGAGAP
jgi:N-methylhydantoinase A/oxoprolinase/acetone carboxylase beta subunit